MSVICNLQDQIDAIQAQIDAITDDQQLTLVGNTLILEDGGSVDLTPFLDNTDDQIITAFSLAGTILTLTIEDGNTVTVDLASLDTDTDDQTLSLAGTILTIADGNSVDLASIDTDDQVLSINNCDLTISGGNTVDISGCQPDLSLTRCTGNYGVSRYAGFQGQAFPVTATNFTDQILGWFPTANYTVPCDGYVHVDFDQPWVRTGVRDSFNQTYVDVRLMVNGAAVSTRTNYVLLEHWWPDNANNNVDWRNHSYGSSWYRAVNAGDVIHVEHRYKTRKIRDTGPQTYNRLLVYREQVDYLFVPEDLITDVQHV